MSSVRDKQDRIYRRQVNSVAPFAFDDDVANVFDDMVERSIPGYRETLRLSAETVRWCVEPGGSVLDVGGSTGALLVALAPLIREHGLQVDLFDNSPSMVEAAQQRVRQLELDSHCKVALEDVETVELSGGYSCCVMNYVLQFIPVAGRPAVLRKLREAMAPGGLLLFSEKTIATTAAAQNLLDEFYYAFKRANGYSEQEIAGKRAALENVLIPLTADDNVGLLRDAGFVDIQRVHQWYPFVTWIARR